MAIRWRSNFSWVMDLPCVGSAPRADSKSETGVGFLGLIGGFFEDSGGTLGGDIEEPGSSLSAS